ncbi:NmrA family NAD(P)-binding protein [Anaerolineales bacterium HSG24]|nr:NmrA family NAD(P)-binding protein [Anaerolineales bacterium HSG24]
MTKILITGAAGKTGQAIISALAKRGAYIRAFVYRADYRPRVEQVGAHEVVVGSLTDEAALQQAMQGVQALYHICPNMNPDEVEIGRGVIQVAQHASVERFIYHSVLHPQIEAMPHHWHKLRVEEMLFESGLSYTILQPAAYMQNILAGWQTITEQGRYAVPYPVSTRLGMVDLLDVAAVAATVLTETGHTGAIYELAGPDILSQIEVATLLSEQLERTVTAEQIPLDTWTVQAQQNGLGDYQINTLWQMFQHYAEHDFYGNANVLGWLLDRPPTSFLRFLKSVG